MSDVLLWTPSYGRAKAGLPAQTYIQQLYVDTGCSPVDLPKAMKIRKGGACGVMVIVVENGHDDTSSNPGRD